MREIGVGSWVVSHGVGAPLHQRQQASSLFTGVGDRPPPMPTTFSRANTQQFSWQAQARVGTPRNASLCLKAQSRRSSLSFSFGHRRRQSPLRRRNSSRSLLLNPIACTSNSVKPLCLSLTYSHRLILHKSSSAPVALPLSCHGHRAPPHHGQTSLE